ncbi:MULTISPECIES: ELWxxDGT repeat protein [Flavobacterium]|uniref:ELWxxDGT repeat protein n=1 Tax=Flavobacterium jumunjinense TaxID=998845 RepID=A0ABV5GK47_9FLAO|nr:MULTISPECIES: ELWxxDGT repeat protein [Flavobacterium]
MKIKKITLLHVCLLFSSFLLHAQYNFELIKDINPNGDSNPGKFTYFNNKLIFTADDGVHGREPWISDGTNAGTFMLKDFVLNGNSDITDFQVYNDKAYFNADDGVNSGIWVTDGTTVGTQFLKNVQLNTYSGIVFNGLLYFSGNDGTSGRELWVTDGTTNGTNLVKDINSNGDSDPQHFFELNGNLYFFARNPQNFLRRNLWITDGTTTGTIVVNNDVDFANEINSDVVVYNNKAYFPSFSSANGSELWSTDGTTIGTQLLKDINPGANSSSISFFKVFNNKLFFSANDGSVGRELWVTDGTTNGTVLFHNFLAPGDGDPLELTVLGNRMYMRANGPTIGSELFATTGNTGINNTYLVKDIALFGANSRPFYLNTYNNELFFIASDDPSGSGSIFDLWVSNGTQQGTIKIAPPIAPNIGPLNENERNFTVVNNSLFFTASFNSNGNELWKLTATNLSASEFDWSNELKVYPNPSDDLVTIQFQNDFKGSYSLFNHLGKQILTHTINSLETQISLEKYTSGMYLLVLSSDNGEQIQTYKILKK